MVEQLEMSDFHSQIFKHFNDLAYLCYYNQINDELIFISPTFSIDKQLTQDINNANSIKILHDDFHKSINYNTDFSDTTISIYSKDNINESLYNQFCLHILLNQPQYVKYLLNNYIYSDFIFDIPPLLETKEQLKNFFINFPLYHINDEHNIIHMFDIFNNIETLSKEDKYDIVKNYYITQQEYIEHHTTFPYFRDYILNYFKEEPQHLIFFQKQSKLFNHHITQPQIIYYNNNEGVVSINSFDISNAFNIDYLTTEQNNIIIQAFTYSFINSCSKDILVKNKDIIMQNYLSFDNTDTHSLITEIDFQNCSENAPIFINLLDTYFKEIKDNQPLTSESKDISHIINSYGWGEYVDSFINYHLISDNINKSNSNIKKIKL